MTIKTIRIKNKAELSPQAEREVKAMIITLAMFAAGMIVGAGIMKNLNSTELSIDFTNIFDIFTQNRNEQKAYQIFLNSLSVNFLFLTLTFCSGLSCIGIPIITAVPIIKGIGYGMLSGYLLSVYKMSGIGYYLLTVFPGAVIAAAILMLACSSAGLMAADILSVILAKKQAESSNILHYIKRFLIYAVISLGASAIDTALTKAFSYLFEF